MNQIVLCGWLNAIRSCFIMEPCVPSTFSIADVDSKILPEEQFYRRIPNTTDYLKTDDNGQVLLDENGKPKLSSEAFSDRSKQVSVDRARLLDNLPIRAKERPTDFVVSLEAQRIWKIQTVPSRTANEPRNITIRSDPQQNPENIAHCLIIAAPTFEQKDNNHFKKLKQALLRIAQWEIEPPTDHKPSQLP